MGEIYNPPDIVQLLSPVQLFMTLWTAACQASLSFTISWSSNSSPLSQWCHPITLSSVVPFSSSPQSFPASGSFSVSQFFPSGGRSIGASATASILPMNIQDCFPLALTGWISLQSKGFSRVFSSITVQKHEFFGAQPSLYDPALTSIHDYWKIHSFDYTDLCQQSKVCFLICSLCLSQLSFQGANIF